MIRFTVARQATFAAAFTVALIPAPVIPPHRRIPPRQMPELMLASATNPTRQSEVNNAL
jgi:hypothetical protein